MNKIIAYCILSLLYFAESCCSSQTGTSREHVIQARMKADSMNKCEYSRREALEQIKRDNLVLYRDFDNYIHASEYFFNKYGIRVSPENKYIKCAQEVMDSIIFNKYGSNILSLAREEMGKIYVNISDDQISSGVFLYAEKQPEYPGGIDSLYCDIYRKVPKIEKCNINSNFSTFIVVSFIVDAEGNIKNPQIVTKLCPYIDTKIRETIGALSKKWKPAIINNKPVEYQMTLNIDWAPNDVRECDNK